MAVPRPLFIKPKALSILSEKKTLREQFAERRATAALAGDEAARRLALVFLGDGPEVRPNMVVAGYWPFRSEIDVRPLLDELRARGAVLALPVTSEVGGALVFREYQGGIPSARDAWDIPTPPETAPEIPPDIVIVPGLAFDGQGHRLGYGAGNYDRTLAGLRGVREIVAVGVGYEEQVAERLPVESHDAQLDWIITPRGVRRRPA